MTNPKIRLIDSFESYLVELFRENEERFFSEQELLDYYKKFSKEQTFYSKTFAESINSVNQVLKHDGRYIEEQKRIHTNQVMYANMPIEKPVSKSIIPVDILSRGYQVVSNPKKQHEFYLAYDPLNEKLLKSDEQLKFLFNKYGIKKQTVMKMNLGLDDEVLSIPVFNYSTAQYPTYETPEVMNIKYIDLNDNNSKYYEQQTTSQLAMINSYSLFTSVIVVVKDYFQAFLLWQFLNKKGLGAFYHIVLSPDNIDSLLEQISQIDLNKYKTFYLSIGGSKRADKVSSEILSKYPMFKRLIQE